MTIRGLNRFPEPQRSLDQPAASAAEAMPRIPPTWAALQAPDAAPANKQLRVSCRSHWQHASTSAYASAHNGRLSGMANRLSVAVAPAPTAEDLSDASYRRAARHVSETCQGRGGRLLELAWPPLVMRRCSQDRAFPTAQNHGFEPSGVALSDRVHAHSAISEIWPPAEVDSSRSTLKPGFRDAVLLNRLLRLWWKTWCRER